MEKKRTNRLKSLNLVGQAVNNFYEELRQAPSKGRMVAWCDGFPLPFPILRAMDIDYLFGDAYAATTAARHLEKELQEVAEDHGYLREICSYTRNTMGCALFPEERKDRAHPMHLMPKPDFIVVNDPGCSMLVNWGDDERRLFNVPIFVIQFQHCWEMNEADEAVADTVRQLREFIVFLEDITHRKFDWQRLKSIMVDVKKATTLRKQGMEMCKNIPSPATFFDWAASLGGINYMLGKPECVDVYQAIHDEVQERAKKKEGAVIGEKYRLYWDGIACWPKLGHLAEKFANLGACVVAGRYTHYGFYSLPERIDPENPLEGLAINGVMLHANQNLDWLIENISRLCQNYSIDGLIMHAHHTCRPLAAPQLEILDGVSRKIGIPGVFVESDVADETFYSEAQVDTRLEALIENIEASRGRR
jgi:benzoyl-CoA reductase subunit B